MTLGVDCEGRPILVEAAREDAQAAYNGSKSPSPSSSLKLR